MDPMEKKYIWGSIIIILVVLAGIFYMQQNKENPLSVISIEEVKNWDFEGPYEASEELKSQALAEIKRLEGLFEEKNFTEYELNVSIANQYDLLGDGKKTYEYLSKAIRIDSEKTGLAWNNMARLMEKLGAYENAKIAFDLTIKAQPIPAFYIAQIDFLERHFPDDKASIEKAKNGLGTPNGDEKPTQ